MYVYVLLFTVYIYFGGLGVTCLPAGSYHIIL